MFGRPQHLHPFFSEIGVEARKRQPRTVDRGLANFPMESHPRPLQLHQQLFSVRIVKALDRDNRDALLLIACRSNRLGPAFFRHQV
jgi:hypothetical protein